MTNLSVSPIRFGQLFSSLLLILGLILLIAWLLKRFFRVSVNPNEAMKVLGTLHLGVKEKIFLVQVGSRFLLLGATPANINTLADLGETLPTGFADLLKKTMKARLI